MQFQKVRVSWKDYPKRLYRVFYVRENIRLDQFAEILQELFEMTNEHLYCFRDKGTRYVTENEMEDAWGECELLKNARFSDLPEKCAFEYDYGESYDFEVRKYRKTIEKDSDDNIILEEAVGAGIFEDNRYTLEMYLSGNASPNMRKDNDAKGLYMPWNLDLKKLGDFEAPIDLQEMEESVNLSFPGDDDEEDEDGSEDFWSAYDTAVQEAYIKDGDPMTAWQIFTEICGQLQKENRLPKDFANLEDIEYGPMDLYYLMDDFPESLEIQERYNDVLDAMKYLQTLFRFEEYDDVGITEHICIALGELKKYDAEFQEALRICLKYPDNLTAQALLLKAYDHCGKNTEAQNLIDLFMKENPLCNEESYQFYAFAAEYYEKRSNKKEAKKLRRMLKEEDARELSYFDEDEPFEDEDGVSLRELLETYRLQKTEFSYYEMIRKLIELFDIDAGVLAGAQIKRCGIDISYTYLQNDGKNYLVMFTEPDSCSYYSKNSALTLSIRDLFIECEMRKADGIVLDPSEGGPVTVIPRDIVLTILAMTD